MKTLRSLSSDIVETAFVEPAVHHHTIGQHLSGDGNRIIALRVGPAGIIVTDGKGVFDSATNLKDASMATLCAITAERMITGRTSNETYDLTKPTGMVS